MSRSDDYESKKNDMDSLEGLSDKLKTDLRRHIRCIESFPVLTDSWCDMAETMGRIATVSDAEGRLPKEHEEATLWETEEAALRYVLEDGKLNLCLRNMVDYKEFERKGGVVRPELLPKCDKFEKGLGVVLRNAWAHVEAIQTTDLPLLISYTAAVLRFALDNPVFVQKRIDDKSLCQRQEVIVVSYVQGLMKRIDDVGEDRVMGYLKESRLFSLILQFGELHWKALDDRSLICFADALSLITLTEDFVTFKKEYCDDEDAKRLAGMEEDDWLDNICEEDDVRRKIRPILDFTRECKRSSRK